MKKYSFHTARDLDLASLGNVKLVARGKRSKSFQCGDYVLLAWHFSQMEKKKKKDWHMYLCFNENMTLDIHWFNMAAHY